ncbi:hypothetical protein BGW80DRAFT_1434569 [Lactifluus volemus]|nr:hypothetical protein BGW80DRAFT_1434569 [Lactifluus volemus]
MALLLNRIQNIVAPSRRPLPHQSRWSFFRLILPSIFPLDLSSTYSRTVLRLPTMYFILKSLLLWTILLLQAPLLLLDDWASRKEMDEICWFTFRAICGALCVGALTRGLEGVGSTNASPFNLFGYSFLLHFYSSTLTHQVKPEGLPSRPDVNVIFTIFMPLFQLSMIHFLGAKQSWSSQRLIPTTICSVLTLAHFHFVLWSSPSSYPLLNYVTCIFESLLLLVILLAFTLNVLTQLLLEGSITHLFIGHAPSLMPKWDDDFSIVLLRLGVASLEATSVAGFGNEVSTVKPKVQYGQVEMNCSGVVSVTHMIEDHEGRRTRKDGFANEVKLVKVGSSQSDPVVDTTWFTEFKRFGYAFSRFAIGCCRMVGRILRGQPAFFQPTVTSSGQTQKPSAQVSREGGIKTADPDQRDVYERFLSGEMLSDDEDDFSPSIPQYDDDDDDAASDTPDEEVDTQALLSELSTATTSYTSAPMLLAHIMDTSSSPLTRRRYRGLVSRQEEVAYSEQSELEAILSATRANASRRDPPTNDSRRNCVICTVEERQIVFWPCRCLALCDDCRQNLASRLSASKHTCPCCRQPVEGFSRIYNP